MLPPLRSAIRPTYRSARSALVQENNSNKVLKETLLGKIDSPVKKKLFLKLEVDFFKNILLIFNDIKF